MAGTTAAAPINVKSGGDEGTIDIEEFKKILAESPESIQLIDVRDKQDFDAGHIKTATHIPIDDLEKNVASLNDSKPIVFVCNTGAQSGEAYYMLQDLRSDLKKVYFLDGQIIYQKDGSYTIKKP